jgi:hypothetical protein
MDKLEWRVEFSQVHASVYFNQGNYYNHLMSPPLVACKNQGSQAEPATRLGK